MSDDDELTNPRVWVGCLGCYNAGDLVGRWVDAIEANSVTVKSLHSEHHVKMNLDSAFHEELWCLDIEGFGDFLTGEVSPWEAQRIAEMMAQIPDYIPRAAVGAYLDHTGNKFDEFDLEDFNESYCGEWDSEQDYAENYAEEVGAIDENLSWPHDCIDWEKATRELMMDYYSSEAPGGKVYIFRSM